MLFQNCSVSYRVRVYVLVIYCIEEPQYLVPNPANNNFDCLD